MIGTGVEHDQLDPRRTATAFLLHVEMILP